MEFPPPRGRNLATSKQAGQRTQLGPPPPLVRRVLQWQEGGPAGHPRSHPAPGLRTSGHPLNTHDLGPKCFLLQGQEEL